MRRARRAHLIRPRGAIDVRLLVAQVVRDPVVVLVAVVAGQAHEVLDELLALQARHASLRAEADSASTAARWRPVRVVPFTGGAVLEQQAKGSSAEWRAVKGNLASPLNFARVYLPELLPVRGLSGH